MITQSKENLEIFKSIRNSVNGFHHHVSVLKDISDSIDSEKILYVEIGCFAGATSCLMLQDPRVTAISIDLGFPISPDVVIENIKSICGSNERHTYIKGDSTAEETIGFLKSTMGDREIDILFIDGDHSHSGVIRDFENYSPLVKKGGYIIFDDYLDFQNSPEVHGAVDTIVKSLKGYEIIGCPENRHNAIPGVDYGERFQRLNDYIVRKNG